MGNSIAAFTAQSVYVPQLPISGYRTKMNISLRYASTRKLNHFH
jgi:hypothetical protein